MIYPDISLDKWMSKYSELFIEEGICNHCGEPMLTTKPFVETGYVGLESPPCICGKNTNKAMTVIAVCPEKALFWIDLLNE